MLSSCQDMHFAYLYWMVKKNPHIFKQIRKKYSEEMEKLSRQVLHSILLYTGQQKLGAIFF